ncbi:MAG: CotH kinase family protein [Candidatus Marinimicrobia bacterium]|nr:CotH kinase family protein [Candidatus Neomarinimicrobiota bacterium]
MKKYFVYLIEIIFISSIFSQVIINEYSASNLSEFTDNYQLEEDWIELYNTSLNDLDLSGYFLSDDETNPTKWIIPEGIIIPGTRYITFWCSGRDEFTEGNLHTNFKLKQTKNSPDHVVFSNPNGVIINDIELKRTQLNHSMGRSPNASDNWKIFPSPTKNGANIGLNYIDYAEAPTMSLEAGFFSGSQILDISTDEPLSNIYYTTNGNLPTVNSTLYEGTLLITHTLIYKAIVISNDIDILPSFITFNTYFIDENHALPILSTSASQLTTLLNGNQGLKPHGTIEYFDVNGIRQDFGYGEYNKHGQDSWAFPQRSFDYIARDEMGYHDAIREKLLSLSDRDKFQRIIIRASGDDNYPGIDSSAHMRDIFIQKLANKNNLNVDMRKGERCVVYANGEFWGIYSIREKVSDADYTNYYYNQDKYNVQYLMNWGGTWAQYGGQQAFTDWNEIHSYALNHDLSIQSNYRHVADEIDVTSLVDYILINSFVVCTDWINWNTSWWRGLNPDGSHKKWGYVLWDEDATFNHYINYTNVPNENPDAEPCYPEGIYLDPEEHIVLLNKLLENSEFKQYYITRYMDLLNTAFQEEEMIGLLEDIENSIATDMPQHIERWGGNFFQWQGNVQKIKDFIRDRIEYFPEGLNSCYDLNGPYELTLDVTPSNSGQIKINSILIDEDDYPWTGAYHGGVDMIFEAVQIHNFDYWLVNNHNISDPNSINISFQLNQNDNIIGIFASDEIVDIVINEINYNSNNEFDSEDWIELFNSSDEAVNIGNWIFKDDNNTHQFIIPENTILPSNDFLVLCKDTTLFREQFPNVINYIGNFEFGLSGGGELIRLFDEGGALVDVVEYDDISPWPEEADGNGPTLELIDSNIDNSIAENWSSSLGFGSPGNINSVSLIGDINQDGEVNVIDVVVIVNMILNSEYSNSADMNSDEEVNVVDIIQLVNIILDSSKLTDATSVSFHQNGESFNIIGNGFIGAVQMTLSHDIDFKIQLTKDAIVAEYLTNGNSTTLIIVVPENNEIFKTSDDFIIEQLIVTNSVEIIDINTPTKFKLENVYPNPFNGSTNINFSIPNDGFVTIKIYDLLGKEISTLTHQFYNTGFYNLKWDATNIASGIYFAKLISSEFSQTQKLMLLK